LAKIKKAEARVGKLEAAKLAAEIAARPKVTDAQRYMAALGCLFHPETADDWATATDDERRLFWPTYELWRLMKRLKELGELDHYLECRARWDHQRLDAWIEKYGSDEMADTPMTEEGPITCEGLHSVKESIRSWKWDFAEFGVNKARQVSHLHFNGRTDESIREANIRLAESGSLPPDPLPAFDCSPVKC